MLAGRVGRAHGLDGSFYVTEPVAHLLVAGAEIRGLGAIVVRKGTDDKLLIRLAVTTTKEAVEALRGAELLVSPEHAPPLEEDEFWAEDLEGCAVVDGDRTLGTVARMLPLPSCEALELEDGTLVPLVRDCVRSVDIAAKRIDVDLAFVGE